MSENTKIIGHVAAFFGERNYGWCHELRQGLVYRHFMHVSDIYSGIPTKGALARFEAVKTPRGSKAVNVEIFANRREMERADAAAALVDSATTVNTEVDRDE